MLVEAVVVVVIIVVIVRQGSSSSNNRGGSSGNSGCLALYMNTSTRFMLVQENASLGFRARNHS